MIDRLFTAALTFCLLAGGTAAIGSALFETAPAAPAASVITLPAVEISGARERAACSEERRATSGGTDAGNCG